MFFQVNKIHDIVHRRLKLQLGWVLHSSEVTVTSQVMSDDI